MTYLDTLVRIIPRQKRNFEAQKSRGTGMVLVGFLLAACYAIATLGKDFNALMVLGWILPTYLMLAGGYRVTLADIVLSALEEIDIAVIEARMERAQHG